MNQPDKETILMWINGELAEDVLHDVEAWADENPTMASKLVADLEDPCLSKASIPAEIEPPYPDFLNARIQQAIETEEKFEVRQNTTLLERFKWFLAPAVCVAMAVCFLLGTQFGVQENGEKVVVIPKEENLVYVPSETVSVKQYDSEEATVIILNGLEPIEDDDIVVISAKKTNGTASLISQNEAHLIW